VDRAFILASMRGARASRWILLVVLLGGCIPHPYTRTSSVRYPPKPKNCAFRVSTAGSTSGYEEIGTIGGCSGTDNLGSYKRQIHEQICANGGDLVVAQVNGNGVYCLGTVFRKQNGEGEAQVEAETE
jgi:hypothetical protein